MKLNYKDCFQYFFSLLMHRPKKLCAIFCINRFADLCRVHIVSSGQQYPKRWNEGRLGTPALNMY